MLNVIKVGAALVIGVSAILGTTSFLTEADSQEGIVPCETTSTFAVPSDGMTDEEKEEYFSSLVNQAELSPSNTTRDGYPPSLSDFYNLASSDCSASGEFTAHYLYTLKCFAPNSSNELVIDGRATAEPAATKMYICMYDVTAGRAGTEFTIDYSTMSADGDLSYFDFSFEVGPLNPNHLYAVRLSPQNALTAYYTSFTVSH